MATLRQTFPDSVRFLFIDEVSMLSDTLLAKVDKLLRDVRGRQDLAFGGITVILSGDVMQLPAVSGSLVTAALKGQTPGGLLFRTFERYELTQ